MITEEQREARRKGLGGSDIAAIITDKASRTGTLSPWNTQVDVWNAKLHPEDGMREENEAMVWGNLEEELVARRFEDLTRKPLCEHPKMIVDGCLIANLDRLVIPKGSKTAYREDGVITADELFEAKTASHAWDDADVVETLENGTAIRDGAQGIPPYYLCQCFHYLGRVPSAERIYVAVKANVPCGRYARTEFGIYVLERDDEIISAQDAYARAWWERHIVRGERPEPVCEADCKALWRRSLPATHVTATPEILKAYADLRKAKEDRERAEAEESRAKSVFQKAMGESESVVGTDGKTVVATWKSAKDRVSKSTDWEKVAREIALDSSMDDGEFADLVSRHTTTATKPGSRTFLLKTSDRVREYVDSELLSVDGTGKESAA